MTFTEIVNEIMEQADLTSTEATARVGRKVNMRYKELTSSMGLQTSRRAEATLTAVLGSRFITLTSVEKVDDVFDNSITPIRVLDEISWDEMRTQPLSTDTDNPVQWALYRASGTTVQIALNAEAVTGHTNLHADVMEIKATLSGTDVPAFPESFHDVLVEGVLAEEYRKKHQMSDAMEAERRFKERMGELRLFISKSGFRDIYQGKMAHSARTRFDITLVP